MLQMLHAVLRFKGPCTENYRVPGVVGYRNTSGEESGPRNVGDSVNSGTKRSISGS